MEASINKVLKDEQTQLNYAAIYDTGEHRRAPRIEIIEICPENALGDGLRILFDVYESPYGTAFVASSNEGICRIDFNLLETDALAGLRKMFPHAEISRGAGEMQSRAIAALSGSSSGTDTIKLHLKGSPFRLSVWRALLDIPAGSTETYGSIAKRLGSPEACRAVGAAIGANPVAVFVPCHRAVPAGGALGKYRWGAALKSELIRVEREH